MNDAELDDLARSGDASTINAYRIEIGKPSRFDVPGRAHRRKVERALLVAIERGRELGTVALRGQGERGADGAESMTALGLNWRDFRPFRTLGPKHVTDEEFDQALVQATAEGKPSREHIRALIEKARDPHAGRSERNELLARHRHLIPERVVAQTVDALRGVCAGVELLTDEDYDSLPTDSVREWSRELNECKRVLNQLAKELSTRA